MVSGEFDQGAVLFGPKVFFRNQQFYKLLGADPGDAHPDPFTLTSDDEEQKCQTSWPDGTECRT
jgi:hypothetical protein